MVKLNLLKKLSKEMKKTFKQKKFCFNVFNSDNGSCWSGHDAKEHRCKTLGCLLGHAPLIWPKLWKYEGNHVLLRENGSGYDSILDAQMFFGISVKATNHLFIPNNQYTKDFGGKTLSTIASKRDVVKNLDIFISKVEDAAKKNKLLEKMKKEVEKLELDLSPELTSML